MASRLRVAFFVFLCTSSFELCLSNENDCDYTESYDEIVAVNVKEQVQITKYKWCLDIPPRCPVHKQEIRTVHKNITVPKTRLVRRCCKDQYKLYDYCVKICSRAKCPNIYCHSSITNCKCRIGFTGHMCERKCDVGHWGERCNNTCHEACADCDHQTGCCKTVASVHHASVVGLIRCSEDRRTTTEEPWEPFAISDLVEREYEEEAENPDERESDHGRAISFRSVDGAQTAKPEPTMATVVQSRKPTATVVETQKPALVAEKRSASRDFGETRSSSSLPPTQPQPNRRNDGGGAFVGTVTKMEVTLYKYDDLMKNLIWISIMTVVAIAMVVIVIFVAFFNCYGVSKLKDRRRRSRPAVADKIHETCITTKNLSCIPPDRYTKNPSLNKRTNDNSPIHPEIFCPVFSAPHYTGGTTTVYDSPQPLYEILC